MVVVPFMVAVGNALITTVALAHVTENAHIIGDVFFTLKRV